MFLVIWRQMLWKFALAFWLVVKISPCYSLIITLKWKWSRSVLSDSLWPHGPMYCSLPGSSVHGIFQARVLGWVAISFSEHISYWYVSYVICSLQDKQFSTNYWNCWRKTAAAAKSCQSCPTLCDPMDGSPPDSSVPGILQARILLFRNLNVLVLSIW